jgi:hypothetical protein
MYDKYKRLVWFDPSLKDHINLLYWRVGYEYGKAILRSPLQVQERIRCFQVLARWFISRRGTLLNDIKTAIVQLFPFSQSIAHMMKKNMEKEIGPRGEI